MDGDVVTFTREDLRRMRRAVSAIETLASAPPHAPLPGDDLFPEEKLAVARLVLAGLLERVPGGYRYRQTPAGQALLGVLS